MRVHTTAAVVLAAAGAAVFAEDKWTKHWNDRVEAFRKENATLPANRLNAIFLGDSITEGFPLSRHFKGKPVLTRGIVADRIAEPAGRGIAGRLKESVFDCRPGIVFLMIGVNDLASSDKSPEALAKDCGDLIASIRKGAPKAKIVIQTCLPVGKKYGRHAQVEPRIVKYNQALATLATAAKIPVVDVHKLYADAEGYLPDDLTGDGLHLKGDAYGKWAEALKAHLP